MDGREETTMTAKLHFTLPILAVSVFVAQE